MKSFTLVLLLFLSSAFLIGCKKIDPDPDFGVKFVENPVIAKIGEVDTAYVSFNDGYKGQGKIYFYASDNYNYPSSYIQIISSGENYVVFKLLQKVSAQFLEVKLVTQATINSNDKVSVNPETPVYKDRISYHALNSYGYNDIFVVSPDGSGKENITNYSSDQKSPCLSFNGDFVLYAMGSSLYKETFSTGLKTSLKYGSTYTKIDLSGDGSRITASDSYNTLYVLNTDGGSLNYNFYGSGSYTIEASLTTGSTTSNCAYIRTDSQYSPGMYYLYYVNASGIRSLIDNTSGSTFLRHVKISADGKYLVYEKGSSTGSNLHLVNLSSMVNTAITSGGGIKTHPSFNSAGTKVVYSFNQTGYYDLYVKDIISNTPSVNITNTSSISEHDPSWN